jgi:glycosyltransferase involved in cell wall biosynthesis
MRSLGLLANPGTWSNPGGVLVGRTVANTQWLKALVQHGSMEELAIFVGEAMDLPALEALTSGWGVPLERLAVYTTWQLPELLARGGVDALHHASHVDRLYDLVALRDRYAVKATPVTGQLHSLSYPRLHEEHARWLLVPPSPTDALFCSSTAGRRTMERTFELVDAAARARGFTGTTPRWNLPVVPLGVDLESVRGGDRAATRKRLGVPDGALLLLGLARFTEFDKVDLLPLLRVLERLVHAPTPGAPPVHLLLAGARQGTQTPELLRVLAQHLGVEARVHFEIDFADDQKRHLLAAADLFVSPVDNVQETFGQSVIEALGAGLPCVVSDFDGYKNTVDETVGVRVPTRLGVDWSELSELAPLLYERPLHLVLGQSIEVDVLSLEGALRLLSVDRARREAMASAARTRAERYAWKAVVGQLEATWRELAATPWAAPHRSHPLRLDYEQLFGHFVTARIEGARRLIAHPRVDEPIIYPELKSLLLADDVRALRAYAVSERTFDELVAFARTRLADRPAWVATFIASWAVKHAIVMDSPVPARA